MVWKNWPSLKATTQERVCQLLALAWAGGSSSAVARSAASLVALQLPEGGWSQMPTMGADAYATGQALFALQVAGKMPVTL